MLKLRSEKGILMHGDEMGLDRNDGPPLKGKHLKTIKCGKVDHQLICRTVPRHNSNTKQLELMTSDSDVVQGSLESQHLVTFEGTAVEHFEEEGLVGW